MKYTITKVPNDPEGLIWHVSDGYRCITKKMAKDRLKMWAQYADLKKKEKKLEEELDVTWKRLFRGI